MVLGSFGPFSVSLVVEPPPMDGSATVGERGAAVMLDGPEPSTLFHGNQAAGLYVTIASLLHAIEHPQPWPAE